MNRISVACAIMHAMPTVLIYSPCTEIIPTLIPYPLVAGGAWNQKYCIGRGGKKGVGTAERLVLALVAIADVRT